MGLIELVRKLPYNHPHRWDGRTFGKPRLWTPSLISTAAWFDAYDESTIVKSGGAVSQWSDKSGNGRHATQGTGAYQPIYITNILNALPIIAFDGSNDFLSIAGSFGIYDTFMVLNCTDGTNFDGWNWPFGGWTNASTKFSTWYGWSGASDISTVNGDMYINGVTNGTDKMSFAPLSSYKIIGSDLDSGSGTRSDWKICKGDNYWGGRVAEVVAFSSGLSSATRQKLEGYLAWKWGIQANLDAGHPYKNTPPVG